MCTSLGKKLLPSRTLRAIEYNFYKQNSLVSLKTTKASRTRSLPRASCVAKSPDVDRSIHRTWNFVTETFIIPVLGEKFHRRWARCFEIHAKTSVVESAEKEYEKRKKRKKDTTKRPTRAGRGLKARLKKTQKEGTTEWILEQQKRDIAWRTDFVTNNSPFRITTFVAQSLCLCAFFNAELRPTYWRIRVRTRHKCFVFTRG